MPFFFIILLLNKILILLISYEGGIKSNATNDVKWQLKVGLHLCLFQIVKIPSLHRYKIFKFLIQSLKTFS